MEYESEGIMAETLKFTDNQSLLVRIEYSKNSIPVCFQELFMSKPVGILPLLDDESRLPKVSDEKISLHHRFVSFFTGYRSNFCRKTQLSFRFE